MSVPITFRVPHIPPPPSPNIQNPPSPGDLTEVAEYQTFSVSGERLDKVTLVSDQHTFGEHCSALLYFVSDPIPEGKVTEITWIIEGHDQGWGGDHPGTARHLVERILFGQLNPDLHRKLPWRVLVVRSVHISTCPWKNWSY